MSNRSLPFTEERLLHALQSLPGVNRYLVGFSGGADSTALLHALSKINDRVGNPFVAVHVNHGLHDDAVAWQTHCETFCLRHQIRLYCLDIDLEHRSGAGLEAEARNLRYQAIETLLEPGDCLLTAHHADDQAETLLLNLLRGSGVDGLSAMPMHRVLGVGVLQRPLLAFQNSALVDYLRDNDIEWLEDPSNQMLNYDRNYLRHTVMPLLETRWPEVNKRLLLSCKAMAQARSLLHRIADEYLGQQLSHPFVLHIEGQLSQDPALFNLVLRSWLRQTGVPSIPAHSLESLSQQVQKARGGHRISIHWAGWRLRFYKHRLWLHTDTEIPSFPVTGWPHGCTEIDLGNELGQLVVEGRHPGVPHGKFKVGNRSNIGANAIRKGTHHQSLKNLFQSAGIPPWLRDYIPLCSLDGELVALGDWCFNEQFATWMSEHQVMLCWRPKNPLLKYICAQQQSRVVDHTSAVR